MTVVDLVVLALVVLAGVGGWQRGLTGVVPALLGALLGLALGSWVARLVVPGAADGTGRVLVVLAVVVVGGLLGSSLGSRLGAVAGVVLARLRLRPVDRAAGVVVRSGLALVALWLLAGILGGVVPASTAYTSDSRVLGVVGDRLPARQAVLDGTARALGVPADVVALVPTGSVEALDAAQVGATTALASESVVKIRGIGCGRGAEGSGFVVDAPSGTGGSGAEDAGVLVVTNAHVVTGLSRISVLATDGAHEAFPVLVDEAADLALLRVDGLGVPTLALADGAAPNGTQGVVLGYPGDADLTAVPATVVQRLPAVQPGVSGGLADREVYRLDAVVRAGNSGGPLVGTDGQVLGVVNARSATDGATGFALTLDPLRADLAAAGSEPVSTGGCAA